MAARPNYQTMLESLTSRGLEFNKPPSAAYVGRLYGTAQQFPSLSGTQLRQAGRGHAFTREHPTRAATAAQRAPEVFRPVQVARQMRLPSYVTDRGNRVFSATKLNTRARVAKSFELFAQHSAGQVSKNPVSEEPHVLLTVRTTSGETITLGAKGGYRPSVLAELMAEFRTRREFIGYLLASQYGRRPREEVDEDEIKAAGADIDIDSLEMHQY